MNYTAGILAGGLMDIDREADASASLFFTCLQLFWFSSSCFSNIDFAFSAQYSDKIFSVL